MVEAPYSIGVDAANAHEFDLKDLGDRRYVHKAAVWSYDGTKQTYGYHSDVKVEDYDRLFRDKLRKLEPPQRVRDLLDHHKAYFEKTGQEVALFLDHLKYNVLHQLEQQYPTSPNTMVGRDWFNKNMDNIHKRNTVDRGRFLAAAYAYAQQQKAEQPLHQSVHHKFIMVELGFDEAKCKRLRDELDQDGLIQILAGGEVFRVLDEGRRALERVEADHMASITIHATNSNVQLQHHSPNATQTASIGDEIQEARTFTEQLSAALPEIQKVASAEQYEEIKEELVFLRKKLDSAAPSKSVVKTIKDELIKRVVGLPFDATKWFGPEILERL